VVTDDAGLKDALENPAYPVIGFNGSTDVVLSTVTEIPAGKTVLLFSKITPKTDDGLTVNGILDVEGGGVLVTAATTPVIVRNGHIEVINGTLQVDDAIDNLGDILGTAKLYFSGGTLEIKNKVPALEDVKTAFNWVPKGTLRLIASTGGITGPVKPSEIVAIPTTLTRRLEVLEPLVSDTSSYDTATSLTVPPGMTFKTADPLTYLLALTIGEESDVTATAATFNRVETFAIDGELTAAKATFNSVTDLTISGTITAAAATYDDVATLVVNSEFVAPATANFAALKSLTVNAGGSFDLFTTSVNKNIGSTAAEFPGVTIITAPASGTQDAGSVEVGTINKLLSSAIAGSLTVTSVVPFDANAELTAAAGGTINGITFPAATPALTATGGDTVTIDDYTVPKNTDLVLATGSTLIVPTGKALTIERNAAASGDGVIKAQGPTDGGTLTISGVEGYTTTAVGVAGSAIAGALAAFTADTALLTDNPAFDLETTFGAAAGTIGIGSVTATSSGAEVKAEADASGGGSTITLNADTSFAVEATAAVNGGTDVASITPANVTLSLETGKLKLTDSDATSTNAKYAVVKFSGLKLQYKELIAPAAVPDFNIGVKTPRS
jgi:hypothetical protein